MSLLCCASRRKRPTNRAGESVTLSLFRACQSLFDLAFDVAASLLTVEPFYGYFSSRKTGNC